MMQKTRTAVLYLSSVQSAGKLLHYSSKIMSRQIGNSLIRSISTISTISLCHYSCNCDQKAVKENNSPIEWAYPHPYDNNIDQKRFLDVSKYKYSAELWDLPSLVTLWENDTNESWPWVWCWKNQNGPHTVFIGVNEETLKLVERVCAIDNRQNLTLIVNDVTDIEKHASIHEFYKNRCAVIAGSVRQIDVNSKVLMLYDERIICFDAAYIS